MNSSHHDLWIARREEIEAEAVLSNHDGNLFFATPSHQAAQRSMISAMNSLAVLA